jgi:hypothetical protein
MVNDETKIAGLAKVSVSDVDSQLIEKIMQKTSEKKITWTRTNNGHSGQTADGNLVIVLTKQQSSIFGNSWSSFNVRRSGEEILKLESAPDVLRTLAGYPDSPANRKVTELLIFLDTARQREVKEAISDLDKL